MIDSDFSMQLAAMETQAKIDNVAQLVVGVILFDGDKILIFRRVDTEDFLPGLLELPSGHIDEGEEIKAALARELQEETNLTLSSVKTIGSSFDYLSQSGKKKRQINFIISATGELKLNPLEHSNHYWMNKSEIKNAAPMSEETKKIILEAYEQLSES